MQPPFYTVVKGDGWHLPGEQATAQAGGQPDPNAKPLDPNATRPGFDPSHPPKDMTPAEARAASAYRKQKAQEAAAARRAAQPPRGTPHAPGPGAEGPGRGGPGGFAPNDPGRPPGAPRPPLPRVPTPEDGVGPIGSGIGPGEAGMEGMAPQQPQLNPSVQGMYPLPPAGEFDPRLWVDPKNPGGIGELVGWAHDATAEPGKTYRYKIRYKMKNPIFGTQNVAKPPQLAADLALVSPDSQWTPEIHIPALTSFFVATVNPGGDSARIEVYRWQAGETHSSPFTVKPGDIVGTPAKGIDFGTGFTVVDLRQDAHNDPYVLLMDSTGQMIRRDPRTDQANPELQRMRQQVSVSQNNGAPAVAGGAAGAGPGGH
jgi:hypothetical protein